MINLKLVIGITGSSGIVYGLRLLDILHKLNYYTIVIYTNSALEVSESEFTSRESFLKIIKSRANEFYRENEISAPLASSSNFNDIKAVVIAPCSFKTLSNIVSGNAVNLLIRVALNALRLRKKLVLAVRETPLGYVEVLNMLKALKAGALLVPAMPGFYHNPKELISLVDFIVGKILDVLDIRHSLNVKWRGPLTQPSHLCVQLFGSECF